MAHDDRPRDAAQPTNHLNVDDLQMDTDSPRTRSPADQVKVWEEEGGSPPGQIGATVSIKPKRGTKAGAMRTARA